MYYYFNLFVNFINLYILQEQGYTVVNKKVICNTTSITFIIYISLSMFYKVIIHVIGLILAFMTRKVNIDPLDESRYSSILIYISSVILALVILFIFIDVETNTNSALWTTFMLIEVIAFLGLTFIPKVHQNSNQCTSVISPVHNKLYKRAFYSYYN